MFLRSNKKVKNTGRKPIVHYKKIKQKSEPQPTMTIIMIYLIEGKCLMTTSNAWIVSKGTLGSRPDSASCRACRLTQDTHLMDTLKLRSLPSPGIVTSSSTCVMRWDEKNRYNAVILQDYSVFLFNLQSGAFSFAGWDMKCLLCLCLWATAWQCRGSSFHHKPAFDHQRSVF